MPLTLVSWNVNSIKARLAHVQRFLSEQNPDVLFIQELKGESLPDISEAYDAHYVGQKAYNGAATLIRKGRGDAAVIATRLAGDDADEQARYLELDWNGLRLINIYLPNGNPVGTDKFSYKLGWMARLYHRLKELREAGIPFLVGGDFNVIPTDLDCYDPELWRGDALFHPDTLRAWRTLLSLGLTDAYRAFDTEGDAYTFWDYQAGAWPKNHGIRIDHFLTSPPVTDRLVSAKIDRIPRGWDTPSDHTPILIEISE